MRFLRFVVAIIVILLLLFWLGFCRNRPAHRCDENSVSAECRVQIGLGGLQYSTWPDGSTAIAVPLINNGRFPAKALKVISIAVTGGTRTAPTSLPLDLGPLGPGRQVVMQTQWSSVPAPGSYVVRVKGTYDDKGAVKTFEASGPLVTKADGGAPIPAAGTTVTTHQTTGPLAPGPIHAEDPNGDEHPLVVPIGPPHHPFTIAPSGTAPAKAPTPGAGGASVTLIQDTSGEPSFNSYPPDPSTAEANAAGVVLTTANTYLLYSKNNGASFTQINPTTIFPNADGGLCCDQVIVYDKAHDLFFWLMQYYKDGSGNNRLRLAFAHPADIKTNINTAWTWVDLTNATVNSSGWLDYPDLALTSSYIYVSVDGTDSKGKNGGMVVARMPLAQMLLGSGHQVSVGYFGPNESTDLTRTYGGRLAQSSGVGMYWAGQKDTSDLEVFHWDDGSSQVASHVAAVNTWCQNGYASLASDNNQWIDNTKPQGTGSVIAAAYKAIPGAHGELWFGWGADADGGGCSQGRTLPYVKIVRIDDTALTSVGEYQIWNSAYAFAYPSLASAPNGDIGVAVSFAGSTSLPTTTVGYLGDYTVYYVDQSALTLAYYLNSATPPQAVFTPPTPTSTTNTRYGDMFAVRRSGSNDADFSTEGYSWQYVDTTKSTSCATAPGCIYRLHYLQFGRPPTPPIR